MACIDYGAKEARLVSYANLSGNIDADRVRSEDAYRECRGLKPEWAAPIVFGAPESGDERTMP